MQTQIRIKVQGGTLADEFLCETCTMGTIMRGPSMKQSAIRCSAEQPSFEVPFRIVQCNRYSERDSTNLMRMKNEAYYIHKNAYDGVHVVTRAQFEDYDYMQRLEEKDARRSRTLSKPTGRTKANPVKLLRANR